MEACDGASDIRFRECCSSLGKRSESSCSVAEKHDQPKAQSLLNHCRLRIEVFLVSTKSEVEGLMTLGAIEALSLERSREFRSRHPERCVPTQFVERWKLTDAGKVKRHVVQY